MIKLMGVAIMLFAMPVIVGAQVVDGEEIYHILPKDAISAILAPELVSAAEGVAFMADDEQILGVVGPNGTAVAYSTWYLDSHEIVNDIIDGVALAATW